MRIDNSERILSTKWAWSTGFNLLCFPGLNLLGASMVEAQACAWTKVGGLSTYTGILDGLW